MNETNDAQYQSFLKNGIKSFQENFPDLYEKSGLHRVLNP